MMETAQGAILETALKSSQMCFVHQVRRIACMTMLVEISTKERLFANIKQSYVTWSAYHQNEIEEVGASI